MSLREVEVEIGTGSKSRDIIGQCEYTDTSLTCKKASHV